MNTANLQIVGAADPVHLPAAATPMEMLHRAVSQGASVEVLEKLLALQERWEAGQARRAFDAALAAAKAEIPTVFKNREVDFTSAKGRTHYRYEDLGEIARTIDPVLAARGLSYRFRTSSSPNEPITVTCILSHRDGHSEENTLTGGRDDSGNKNHLQAIGSTISFLSRYALKAALGLSASEDDDGRAAGSDTSFITDEQAASLRSVAEEVGADLVKFCQYLRVDSIPAIPASQFRRAMMALEAKRKVRSHD